MPGISRRTTIVTVLLAGSLLLLAETLTFGFMSDDFVMVYRIREKGSFGR